MMRITNAMMTSNTKNNININKLNEDRLNTQIATGQVISRPSEDPVVAIRALRLNTNLSQLTQYYKKNIPDAQAWLNVTETALKQTDQIFTNIKENLTTGASDTNTATDRQKILESLKGLRAELYSSGNADYAERTVFTGYRTNEPLTFLATDTDLNSNYKICEPIGAEDLEKVTYITSQKDNETDVKSKEIYRVRLAYDNNNPEGSFVAPNDNKIVLPNGDTITVETTSIAGKSQAVIDKVYTDFTGKEDTIRYIPETGELIFGSSAVTAYKAGFNGITFDKFTLGGKSFKVTEQSASSGPFPNADEIVYDPKNGELTLGANVLETINNIITLPDHKITLPNGKTYDFPGSDVLYNSGKITFPSLKSQFKSADTADVIYNKSQWKSGDLRPEHYFACVQTVDGKETYFNYAQKSDGAPDPERPLFQNRNMEVEISFNQKITINTHANEVYTHDIGRDIDELLSVTQAVVDADERMAKLEEEYKNNPTDATLKAKLDAAGKEYSLKKDKMQKMFSAALDTFEGYADRNNLAIANIGSLQQRLTITKERVADQLQSFKELADANINAELTESSIDFASAKLALEAAQMAAGKIAQQTLLNYL
ncbi:MAG: hypothetical protein J5910_02655 [Lachnospiraceae bacterium]|nr:hypothetical protein [Lachnospiraceae bacterium]